MPDRLWRDMIAEAAQDALPSQTPGWRSAVCAQGWQDATRLYTWPDGARVLLPLARSTDGTRTQYASWPEGWGVGGVVAAAGVVTADRAEAILGDLAALPADQVYLRPHHASVALWDSLVPPGTRRNPRMLQILDLEGGFEHVWRHRFRGTLRTAVRRAERAGLTIERDGTGRLLPEFDRLFELSLDRWDDQSDEPRGETRRRIRAKNPPTKFTAVADHLGHDCQVWMARHGGQAIAAVVTLYQGPYVVYWQGAMDKERAAPARAAPYLLHLVAEDACARGARALYLGDTYPGTSVTRFKKNFGPDEYQASGFWIPGRSRAHERRRS
ncbi:GNAT family N-acetyltransferase [Actinomadura graeca]|uniref:GNAT family N-acetyltransferase n=1 Tax=Actinomadura graeca TaxID=2750812 RepID=A0ABX8R631_9ACTN|nr:GNAT family N-acetyltransferase [Actinomadura graeca]QXJ25704.1 GNAT family N-acetyltransferase [Actinomadura graeca]